MNKFTLTLAAGALLATASCNTDTGNTEAENQAKIDSIVDVRVDEIRMELYQRNDSIINELAMWRADSILAARAGKKVTTRKPKPKPLEASSSSGSTGTTTSEKKSEEGTVNDRPGSTNNGGTVNDRPGATNNGGTVNDRPGATNK